MAASPEFRRAMWTSLADALGFVLGFLAGRYFGKAIGYDFFERSSADGAWDSHAIVSLLLILVGLGLGRVLFRWLFARLGKI